MLPSFLHWITNILLGKKYINTNKQNTTPKALRTTSKADLLVMTITNDLYYTCFANSLIYHAITAVSAFAFKTSGVCCLVLGFIIVSWSEFHFKKSASMLLTTAQMTLEWFLQNFLLLLCAVIIKEVMYCLIYWFIVEALIIWCFTHRSIWIDLCW